MFAATTVPLSVGGSRCRPAGQGRGSGCAGCCDEPHRNQPVLVGAGRGNARISGAGQETGQIPCPAHWGSAKVKMIQDVRKAVNAIAERAGWKRGEIHSRRFQTTYANALQTLDRGAPMAVWTVPREIGHSSTAMVERVYGKLGQIRHRSEVAEYRVEQHREKLRERLEALQ